MSESGPETQVSARFGASHDFDRVLEETRSTRSKPKFLLWRWTGKSEATPTPASNFHGNLSSFCHLVQCRAVERFQEDLRNLQIVNLTSSSSPHDISLLLAFFESAPQLHTIKVQAQGSIHNSSNLPTQRIISLPNLKIFTLEANPPHSTLRRHLSQNST